MTGHTNQSVVLCVVCYSCVSLSHCPALHRCSQTYSIISVSHFFVLCYTDMTGYASQSVICLVLCYTCTLQIWQHISVSLLYFWPCVTLTDTTAHISQSVIFLALSQIWQHISASLSYFWPCVTVMTRWRVSQRAMGRVQHASHPSDHSAWSVASQTVDPAQWTQTSAVMWPVNKALMVWGHFRIASLPVTQSLRRKSVR